MALLVCIIFGYTSTSYAQITFHAITLDSAIVLAKDSHKLVLIDFRADWCKPCLEMEQTTFQDSALGAYVNDRFVCIKIDIDDSIGGMIARRYSVSEYPTILNINPLDGKVLLRIIGFKPAKILMGDLKMLEKYLPTYIKKD